MLINYCFAFHGDRNFIGRCTTGCRAKVVFEEISGSSRLPVEYYPGLLCEAKRSSDVFVKVEWTTIVRR
jgi:hypothetical protein